VCRLLSREGQLSRGLGVGGVAHPVDRRTEEVLQNILPPCESTSPRSLLGVSRGGDVDGV